VQRPLTLLDCSLTCHIDTVTDFSWEPKGERFAIVSSNDPNLGNPGPGITIKTDIGFYQLDRAKNDFKLLRTHYQQYWLTSSFNLLTNRHAYVKD
jgi:uncharacterized protein with WD repeat